MATITDRNPTGVSRTPDELDELFRRSYWFNAIEYGLQYYVSGRFATAHHHMPVSANILHHAVELLLKACLAKDDTAAEIRGYGRRKSYSHDIQSLWLEFKRRQHLLSPQATLPPEFDDIVFRLHKFEDIRYPEALITDGATISIGIFEVETPLLRNGVVPENAYTLMLPQIDRLVAVLFEASGVNPEAVLPRLLNDDQGMRYYERIRSTFLGRPASTGVTAPIIVPGDPL